MSTIPYLNRALEDYLKQVKTSSKRVPFIATTIYTIKQTCKKDVELRGLSGFLNEVAQRFPETTSLHSVFDELEPEFMMNRVYPLLTTDSQASLRDAYLSLFRIKNDRGGSALSEDQANLLLAVIAQNNAIFATKKSQVARALEEMFHSLPYLENFTEKHLQNNYITRGTLAKFIESIKYADLANDAFRSKLDLLIKMDVATLGEQILSVLADMSESATQTNAEPKIITQLNKRINMLLTKIREEVAGIEDKTRLSIITKNIASWYDVGKDFFERAEFIPNMLILSQLPDYPDRSILDERLRNFSRHATVEALHKLKKQNVEYLVNLVPHEFRANLVDNMSIYPETIKYFSDDQKVALVRDFLSKSSQVSTPEQKDVFFEKIAELKAMRDSISVQTFYEQLVGINSPDLARKYGRRQFFNSAQKQGLANIVSPLESEPS